MSHNQEALIDILEAIKLILQYAKGLDFDGLANNVEKQDAILRRISIIGEATKRLSNDFRAQHPEVPWKEMAGMRDVIIHRNNGNFKTAQELLQTISSVGFHCIPPNLQGLAKIWKAF